jgi:zinc transport system ATP-binding protein
MSDLKNEKLETIINLENITVNYGEKLAISSVSLKVYDGDYLAIIGPNGGGKTTLLKSMLGLVTPSTGEIDILGKKPGKTGRLLGYVPQSSNLDKKFPMTVKEVVMTGRLKKSLSFLNKYSKNDIEIVNDLLERVGVYKLRDRMISGLSGGEFQKMLIARALAIEPKIIFLDEPTASVDASSREQIFSLLNELNDYMTIILVTHDLLAVSSHVKKLACLNKDLVYHGSAELNENVVKTLYGCPIDLIAHGVPHQELKKQTECDL